MDPSEDDPGPAAPGSLVAGQQTKSVLAIMYHSYQVIQLYNDTNIVSIVQIYVILHYIILLLLMMFL